MSSSRNWTIGRSLLGPALALALVCLLAPAAVAAERPSRAFELELRAPEPASLFNLVDRLSSWRSAGDDPAPDPVYLRHWIRAVGADPADEPALARYREVRRRYRGAIPAGDLLQALTGSGLPFPVAVERLRLEKKFAIVFLAADGWEDVWRRAEHLLAPADIATLRDVFEHFRRRFGPVARRSLHLNAYRVRGQVWLMRRRPEAFFRNLSRFFRTPPDRPLHMMVDLVWLPRDATTSRAHVVERWAALEVRDGVGLRGVLDVAVHESVHRLHERMPRADRVRVERAFLTAPGAERDGTTAAAASGMLFESLATALGQGTFGRRFFPEDYDPARRWYEDPGYDAYARALEPVVARWVDAGKPMDEAFSHAAVAAYAELVGPDGPPPRDILRRAFVLYGGDTAGEGESLRAQTLAAIRGATRPRALFTFGPAERAEAAAALAAFPAVPVLVVSSAAGGAPPLPAGTSLPPRDGVVVQRRPSAGPIILIRGADADATAAQLRQLLAADHLPR